MCCIRAQSLSHVRLFPTLWTVACQAPLFMRLLQARILEWVAIFPSRGYSQSNLCLLHWQADSLPLGHLGSTLLYGFGQCIFIVPIIIGSERMDQREYQRTKNSWSFTTMLFTLTLLIPANNDLFTVSISLSFSECQLVEISKNFILEIDHFLSLLCLSFPKHTKVCQFYGSFDCYFILSGLLTLLFYFNSPIFGKHTNYCYITSWEGCLVHWFCLSYFQVHALKDKNCF